MDKDKRQKHVHPFMIITNLKQFLILAILPIMRGILVALVGKNAHWAKGLWLDICLLLFILFFAVLKWWNTTYHCNVAGIMQRTGLIYRRRTEFLWHSNITAKIKSPAYLRPFGVCVLYLDSLGGRSNRADIKLLLSRKEAEKIVNTYLVPITAAPVNSFQPSFWHILAFSFFSLNSSVGIVYLATFVSQSGRIMGREFSTLLIDSVETFTRMLVRNIPPAAAILAYIIILIWGIGVLASILQYYSFTVTRHGDSLRFGGGLLHKQHYLVNISKINYISVRQNMVSWLLGRGSLFVSAVGCGKDRSDLRCIAPMQKQDRFNRLVADLLKGFSAAPLQLRPVEFGFMSYLGAPLATFGGILLLIAVCVLLFPFWQSFILFVGAMALLPALVFFIIQLLAYCTSGVGINGECITLCYSTGLTLHQTLIPMNRVVKIKIKQGIFQKQRNNCDIVFYTPSEFTKRHCCRNINRQAVLDLLQNGVLLPQSGELSL